MSLKCGIIGLPNVGKSTLFNALLKKKVALSANYPFATVEPNVGVVAVPDARLERLAEVTKNEEGMVSLPPIVPAVVEFVDIAGLVKGAATGEGLGNKFLAHIREVDAIVHVVRDFGDVGVVRAGSVGPEEDRQIVETELQLADLETVENSKLKTQKSKDQVKGQSSALEKLSMALAEGKMVRDINFTDEERKFVDTLFLLTDKPVLYVRNIGENKGSTSTTGITSNEIEINAKLEEELADFDENERREYLESLGIAETGLEKLIRAAYELLGLISFLTAGVKEVRAFVKFGGWKKSRDAGKVRSEGKDYIVKDGDVVEFKIGS
ncbi:redox-regulated ATPase YchF [Candidatus Microgenomates bacterium]|nr:redox-regulated ATPase YchF [Candidatus Microgenomates bacterium]